MKKRFVGNLIFAGALGAAVFFFASIFVEKEWILEAKIIVYPLDQSDNLKNMDVGIGNIIEILNGNSFKEKVFLDKMTNLAEIRKLGTSSVISVRIRVRENEISRIKEIIGYLPSEISAEEKNIYGSENYGIKLFEEPQISKYPVRPRSDEYALGGFAIGILIYFFSALRKLLGRKKENI
jgi:hypothetical protein